MNNGGRSQRALAIETSLDVQRTLLEVNTLGTISLSQAVIRQMQTQKHGLIVVVSSIAGKLGKLLNAPLSQKIVSLVASYRAQVIFYYLVQQIFIFANIQIHFLLFKYLMKNMYISAFNLRIC